MGGKHPHQVRWKNLFFHRWKNFHVNEVYRKFGFVFFFFFFGGKAKILGIYAEKLDKDYSLENRCFSCKMLLS